MILMPQMMRPRATTGGVIWELKTTSASATFSMNSGCVSSDWYCELPNGTLLTPIAGNPTVNPVFDLSVNTGEAVITSTDYDNEGVLCTDFGYAWYNNSLTSFPAIDLSSGTDFSYAWYGNPLTSFPLLDISSGTSFDRAWRGCSSLTSFPLLDISSGTKFYRAWYSCSSLTSFPANFFDSWVGVPVVKCFYQTWDGCSSLTAQSVENILVSIDASGQSAPSGTGTEVEITVDYDAGTGALSSATTTAITNIKGKGWGITINGVAQ